MTSGYVGNITRTFRTVDSNANQLKVFGLCRFLKLILKNKPKRTEKNPYNQVGLRVFRIWGRESHKCLTEINNQYLEREIDASKIDATLICLGLDILTQNFWENYYNDQLSPAIDLTTKDTIKGMVERREEYIKNEDFDLVKRVSEDITKVLKIGAEIFELQQMMEKVLLMEDYDKAQLLKERIRDLMRQRDNFDAKYQTFRFEQMVMMDAKQLMDYNKQLEREFEIIRKMKEEEERKKLLMEERNKMGKSFYRDDVIATQLKDDPKSEKKILSVKNSARKQEHTPPRPILKKKAKKSPVIKVKEKKEDDYQNEGDRQLAKYLKANLDKANIKIGDLNTKTNNGEMSRLHTLGVLDVFGYNLWNAVQNGDWKARHAAAKAVCEYIKNPMDKRFQLNSYHLFLGCCELARVILEDKVREVSSVGIEIIKKCFDSPICNENIPIRKISDALNEIFPILQTRASEKNTITAQMHLDCIIELIHKPRVDINQIIEKNVLDICEKEKDGKMFYKKDTKIHKLPPSILIPRLNILFQALKSFYTTKPLPPSLFMAFDLLGVQCLQHTDTDVKDHAFNSCIMFYQVDRDRVKDRVEALHEINPHYKGHLNDKFRDCDTAMIQVQNGDNDIPTTKVLLEQKILADKKQTNSQKVVR